MSERELVPRQETRPMFMLLYYCPTCGYWTDRALRDSIETATAVVIDVIARAFGGTPLQRDLLPDLECPDGHGKLVQVNATDRIAVIQEAKP